MPQPTAGPIVLQSDIERAVRDTLKATVPFYLAEIDEQLGLARGTTKPPRTWGIASEDDRWLEETPPALLVVCPGTVDEPVKHGDRGSYGAWWQINIGVTVGGATEEGTRELAARHAGAVQLVLGQQADMGGLAADTVWQGTRSDVVGRERTLMACEVLAYVRIARVFDTRGGLVPRTLPPEPTSPAAPTPTPTGVRIRVPAS